MVKVAIVDRLPVHRQGLETVSRRAGMAVVSASSTLDPLSPHRPDAILLGDHDGPLPAAQHAPPVVRLLDHAMRAPGPQARLSRTVRTVDRNAPTGALVATVQALAGEAAPLPHPSGIWPPGRCSPSGPVSGSGHRKKSDRSDRAAPEEEPQ